MLQIHPQGGQGQARKTPRENEILKFQIFAIETRKLSHGPGTDDVESFIMEPP